MLRKNKWIIEVPIKKWIFEVAIKKGIFKVVKARGSTIANAGNFVVEQ